MRKKMEPTIEFATQQPPVHPPIPPRPRPRIATDLMAFRSRVKELIQEAGTEMALERRAGLPPGSLSHYSRSRPSEPTRPHLVALAAAMDVHLDWLCAGRGPKRGGAEPVVHHATTSSPEDER
jgi:hypothetical protein